MSRVLVKDVIIKIESVQYIKIIDVFEPGEDVMLAVFLTGQKPMNIPMKQDQAEITIQDICAMYLGLVLNVEGYVVNLEEIEHASIDYVGAEVRLRIRFLDEDLYIPMTEEKAKLYLQAMTTE